MAIIMDTEYPEVYRNRCQVNVFTCFQVLDTKQMMLMKNNQLKFRWAKCDSLAINQRNCLLDADRERDAPKRVVHMMPAHPQFLPTCGSYRNWKPQCVALQIPWRLVLIQEKKRFRERSFYTLEDEQYSW